MNDLHKQALSLLAYLFLRHDRMDRAEVLYRALHRLYPEDAGFAATLAYIRLEHKDWDLALELAEGASRTAERELVPTLGVIRARALHGLGRTDEAWAAMRRAVGSPGETRSEG